MPRPCSRRIRPAFDESRQRLLHGADADAVLRGELFLGRQAIALAQCAGLDGLARSRRRRATAWSMRDVAHRLRSKRLTAVSRTLSTSLVTRVPEPTSAT